jgi:hypothetical protein
MIRSAGDGLSLGGSKPVPPHGKLLFEIYPVWGAQSSQTIGISKQMKARTFGVFVPLGFRGIGILNR